MGERFEMRGELGAGAMGTVYRVLDRQSGTEVAMKVLRDFGPNALYRFKREFRELSGLSHPNLVSLHELFVVGDEWMFTMELVDGVSFRDWVAADPARLRPAFAQLTDGLTALHAVGKVHRDVKPSNVMVDREGRVVILDFGLVSDPERSDYTHEGTAIGTPSYMSPEQAADQPVAPPTDWYAVGTMLYEALTGRKPFLGSSRAVLLDKQMLDPRRPSEVKSDVPPDLDDLAMRLLSRDPLERPDGRRVLSALGMEPSAWTRRIAERAQRPDISASRAGELSFLRDALAVSREHPVLIRLSGPSGAGRSTLIETFADEIVEKGGLAFVVRINKRASVPIQGVDMLIDQLTRYLLSKSVEEVNALLPRDLASLARLFPTFRRLPAARLPSGPESITPEDAAARAADALNELLRNLAARQPLGLFLDDMQWARDGGVDRWFAALRRPDAPRVLQIYSFDAQYADLPIVQAHDAWEGDLRRIDLA